MTRYDSTGDRTGDVGDQLFFTSPSGGTIAGQGYLIGSQFCVAAETTNAGTVFAAWARGSFRLAKATGIAWTEGMVLYWDPAAKNLTNVVTSNTRVGCAATAQASGDTIGWARISGAPAIAGVA